MSSYQDNFLKKVEEILKSLESTTNGISFAFTISQIQKSLFRYYDIKLSEKNVEDLVQQYCKHLIYYIDLSVERTLFIIMKL